MTVIGNTYTVAQIDKATARAANTIGLFPVGSVNPEVLQLLIELYLGAIDADKETP